MSSFNQLFLVLYLCSCTLSAYVPDKNLPPHKGNSIGQTEEHSAPPPFKGDRDIVRYLKLNGQKLLIWRCKNAIQHQLNHKPLDYIELYCEVIGRMKSVSWRHNNEEIEISTSNGKFGHVVSPHFAKGKYYSRWIDFKLRIFNADQSDAGLYTFRVTDLSGQVQNQVIYVDISRVNTRKKKHDRKWRRKYRRRRKW